MSDFAGRILLLRPLKERELIIKTFLRLGVEIAILDEPTSDFFGMADHQVPVTSVVAASRRGDTSAIEAAALAFHDRFPVDGVLTTVDHLLPVAGRLNDKLGLRGLSEEAARACTDKGRQRALFAANEVPSPAFAVVDSLTQARRAAADIGYPVVVKPVDRTGSRGVQRADDERQLAAAYANGREQSWGGALLIEEYLDGEELSAESVTVGGRTHLLLTIDKTIGAAPYFVEDGAVVPGSQPERVRERVAEVVGQALQALDVRDTVTHTELRLTATGPKVIEVNGRVAGMCLADMVLAATGIDLYEVQWAALRGRAHVPAAQAWGYLAQRSIVAGSGVVEEVVVDALAGRAAADLFGVRLGVRKGSTLAAVQHSNAVRGVVIARGDTPERAFAAATELRELVGVRCRPAGSETVRSHG
jgi:biotin carboxylase